MQLHIDIEHWPFKTPFRITGYTFTESHLIVVTVTEDGVSGRGEAAGVYYRSETPQSMTQQLEAIRPRVERGLTRERVRVSIFRSFLDRYFPYTAPKEATVSDPGTDAARVAGSYASSRHTVLRILNAVSQSAVTVRPNAQIVASELTHPSGAPKHWREVGPLTWREVRGQAHLKFVANPAGHIQFWISDDTIPVDINQPLHGLGRSSLLKLFGGLFLCVMRSTARTAGHPLRSWQ